MQGENMKLIHNILLKCLTIKGSTWHDSNKVKG